jgi:branched-chain amino acid transport system permease protein
VTAIEPRRRIGSLARGVGEPLITLVFVVIALAYANSASYREDYVVLICTYALLALGMYVPYVMAGGLSLAYNAYLGIGAYLCGIAVVRWSQSSLWGLPLGFILAAVVAALVGVLTGKLLGFYLAGVTLLFATAYQTFITDQTGLTGGANGLAIDPPTFFGQTLHRYTIVVISVVIVWFVAMFLSRLRRAPFGIAVRIKREVPEVVEAVGISSRVMVLVSLGLGAGIASLGGSLFGMMSGVVQPESFDLSLVFLAIFMPLLGGRHSPWGAVLGAAIVVILTFQLNFFKSSGTLVFSVAILVVLRLAPEGILGVFEDSWRFIRRRLRKGAA